MTKMKILEIPSPVLREKATPVSTVTPKISSLLSDMLETMYESGGVGLAANQVGLLQRLVVIDCLNEKKQPAPLKLVNPKIVWRSEEYTYEHEGCLSVPCQFAAVERNASVRVEYLDENGEKQTVTGTGLLAVALQHELDHLDGKLFIDYLSPLKRNRLLKSLEKKRKKEGQEG